MQDSRIRRKKWIPVGGIHRTWRLHWLRQHCENFLERKSGLWPIMALQQFIIRILGKYSRPFWSTIQFHSLQKCVSARARPERIIRAKNVTSSPQLQNRDKKFPRLHRCGTDPLLDCDLSAAKVLPDCVGRCILYFFPRILLKFSGSPDQLISPTAFSPR